MKKILKILLTVGYLFLIPNFAKYLIMVPNLFLTPFQSPGTGLDFISFILLVILGIFIYFVYKTFSSLVESFYIKDNKKIILNIITLLLIALPVIFFFGDL